MYPGTTAAAHPEKAAVILHGTAVRVTYAELEERANRLANGWHAAGLQRGDHVALLTTNDPRALEVYWAAMRAGFYITAVNRHLSADEVAYIVNDCGAATIVTTAQLAALAEAVADRTDVRLRLAFGGPVAQHDSYEDFLSAASAEPAAYRPRGADMLYSSGTTGRPKGIKPDLPAAEVHEHAESLIHLAQKAWGFDDSTVFLSPAPIYHAAPLRMCAAVLALGGTVVLMQKFDAEESLRAIEQHAITHSQWVPTMFVRMLKLPRADRLRYDHSSLRVALHAAAPCPTDVKKAMIEWWGPVLVEFYSSTESNGLTMIDSHEWLEHVGSVGRAVVGTLRICDDEGREVQEGEVGTVYFERDELPFSYHNDPDKTAEAQHPRHPTWTTTGDLGFAREGYLYLTDRKAFMIISGGVNIYPQEIEDCLVLHPAVHDVAVVGVPDEEMGESVRAYVVTAPGVPGTDGLAEDLVAHVRARVAGYKAPRSVVFVDSLPRTPTGKLVKGELRKLVAS